MSKWHLPIQIEQSDIRIKGTSCTLNFTIHDEAGSYWNPHLPQVISNSQGAQVVESSISTHKTLCSVPGTAIVRVWHPSPEKVEAKGAAGQASLGLHSEFGSEILCQMIMSSNLPCLNFLIF